MTIPLGNIGAPIATLEDHEGASKGAIEMSLLGD